MAYTGGFGVDTTGIDFGDTFLPGAGSPSYGTYDFLPRSQFPENFYNTQSNSGGGFLDQFGRVLGFANKAIPGAARAWGAVQDIINPKDSPGIFNPDVTRKSKEEIDKERVKTLGDIQAAFTRIAGTTGISSQKAVEGYLAEFGPALDKINAQGRFDLEQYPDIDRGYLQFKKRADETIEDYSALNSPRFAAAYKAPDAVASVDVNAIEKVMKLGPAYKEQYSYEDPESQKNIYGRRNAIGDIASFYANDPNLNSFMVSATDHTVQDLTRYS